MANRHMKMLNITNHQQNANQNHNEIPPHTVNDLSKRQQMGFPGGAMVENLPANAGGHGFEPWCGKIPHAAEQLGPWATTTEPARLEPVLRSKRGRDSERPVHRDEEWPLLAETRESPRTETKTQHAKN